jgi:hypothetical protein
MRIVDTPIYSEFLQISKQGEKPVHFENTFELLIDGELIKPFKLLSVEISRRYCPLPSSPRARYTDKIQVTAQFGEGTMQHKVYPNKERLIAVLTKKSVGEGGTTNNASETTTERYRAFLLDGKSSILESNVTFSDDEETMDRGGYKVVYFELLNLSVEQLRLMSAPGPSFRDMKLQDILLGVLTLSAGQIELPDEDRLEGVTVEKTNHVDVRDYVFVEQGLPLMDFPGHLQQSIGVYSSGLGHYIQGKRWYVYPEYNLKRYEIAKKRMTVLNVPRTELPMVERTYLDQGGNLLILATGQVDHIDDTDLQQVNFGNSVRLLKGDAAFNGFWEIKDDKVVVDKSKNIHEVAIGQRETGINTTFMSGAKTTSNILNEESKVARRMGSFIRFTWENADADLITPAMPVRYIFMVGQELVTLYGTCVSVECKKININQGSQANRFIQMASVTLFVEKYTLKPNKG